MSAGCNLLGQLQLGPAEPLNGPNIPGFFLGCQFRFQNDHVLCPADGHGLDHDLWGAFIGAVELPHPPQIPGREPSGIRICVLQILRRCHSRALFRSVADQTAYFTVQLHLRQIRRHQLIQRCEQGVVVDWLSDVHGILSFLARCAKFLNQHSEKCGRMFPHFSLRWV